MLSTIKPTQPVMPDYQAYIEEIRDIWDTRALTNNGPKAQKLQRRLQEYLQCPHTDVFVNGHSALVLALRALGLTGEVLTSPFTFVSTINAIEQNGLTPVFCDIDDSYNLDVGKLERHITEKTCAVVAPHIFGIPCDVNGIERIAAKHHLKVIYDGAQAFGTKINGRHIGCYGDVTMFSLHAIKIYNSIEGGLLAYQDEGLHQQFERYRNFGIAYQDDGIDVPVCGINAKMNEFQAAMGLLGLDLVDQEIEKRKALAQIYVRRLAELDGVSTFAYRPDVEYNYAYFPVRIDREKFGMDRDELFLRLEEKGIITRKLYDTLCCDYSYYRGKNYKADVSHARRIAGEALDLPLYGTLEPEQIEYICAAVSSCRGGGNVHGT